jgi:hypothetical protein
MKKSDYFYKFFLLGFFLFVFCFPGFSGDFSYFSVFDEWFIHNLPGGFFYTTYLENYAPDTTVLIEESNGFSIMDNPRVYFEGDSVFHFNWHLNDFNINSSLYPGTPAVSLPFLSSNVFQLRGESPDSRQYGFFFLNNLPEKNFSKVVFSTTYSDFGSYSAWADFMITNPATSRDKYLYTERRKSIHHFFVDYLFNQKFKNSNLLFSVNYTDVKRQFNDFNEFDQTFESSARQFVFNSRFTRFGQEDLLDTYFVFNYRERSNLDAELSRYPQETFDQEKVALFGAFQFKKTTFNLRISVLYENENRDPFVWDFAKDLKDNDGEGFLTFGRIGKFTASVLKLNLDVPLVKPSKQKKFKFDSFADLKYAHLSGSEKAHDNNPIYYANSPYLVYLWEKGEDYNNSNIRAQLGLNLQYDLSSWVSVFSRVWLKYSSLHFDYSDNNLSFLNPGFDVGLLFFKNKKTRVMLAYGHMPYDIIENVNFFLETSRSSGKIYFWDDTNGDLLYQNGESGDLYGYTGGSYHFVDPDLKCPVKQRILLNVFIDISKNWSFSAKGIYKKIYNNFWVKFDREYGFYENIGEQDLYFFNQPFENYVLSNVEFDKDPFYAQLVLDLKGGRENRWFFSFSFMAHIGMGYTAFGNGAGTSDIGVVDESQANPNSWINGYGRLDGDRAFVSRLYFGVYLFKNFFMGMGFKYRDGNPFAFIDSEYKHDQWVLYYHTIKAENEEGVKGGPREDYLGDISVQFNYSFKLFNRDAKLSLSFYNILDTGYELSEYVFSGGDRDAMELNIPPSIRLTFMMNF